MGNKKSFDACFLHLIIFIFSISCMLISFASDTLVPGQSIGTGERLTSPGQIFELRFFTPTNFNQIYLGLTYKNDTGGWVLWVANRENPVSGTSGVLRFTDDGNLTISDSNGSLTTIYSGSAASNSTLMLLDSGNLVLREGNSVILWQSFDHPTDMLFPGMKLGVNLKTQQKWSLAGWLSEADPAPGDFTLSQDPNGTNQLFIWQRGEVLWTSGVWNGSSFPNTPDIIWTDYYNFEFTSNEDEHYFTYSTKNASVVSVLMLYSTGEFIQLIWPDGNQRSQSVVHCLGKSEDWSMGCVVPKSPLNCSNGEKFMSSRQVPVAPPKEINDSSLVLSNCEATCKSNCSCNAYATAYSNGTGCFLWYGELDGYESSSEKDIYFRSQNDTAQNLGKPYLHKDQTCLMILAELLSCDSASSCFVTASMV